MITQSVFYRNDTVRFKLTLHTFIYIFTIGTSEKKKH